MSDDESTKVTITLRTIVTGPEAGCIIGRGGEIVNSIRDESGAKIKIEGSSQQERIITVRHLGVNLSSGCLLNCHQYL